MYFILCTTADVYRSEFYFPALLCPIMPKVPNSAGWKCVANGRALKDDSYPYRTQCRNECDPGYLPRPNTNAFMICSLDDQRKKGKWSGSSLVCERKCSIIGNLINKIRSFNFWLFSYLYFYFDHVSAYTNICLSLQNLKLIQVPTILSVQK